MGYDVCKQIHPPYCFLFFFLDMLLDRAFTRALLVGFPLVLITLQALRFGMKYKIACSLSLTNEIAHAKIGFASPFGSVVPNVFIFQYLNTQFGKMVANICFNCMHRITRILTFNGMTVNKANNMNKARIRIYLVRVLSVNHD